MGSQAIAQPNVGHAREEEKSPDAKSGLLSGLDGEPRGRHGREPGNGVEAKVTAVPGQDWVPALDITLI